MGLSSHLRKQDATHKKDKLYPVPTKKNPHIKFQHARNVRYFFELEELLTCGIAHNFETGAVLLLTQDPHTAQGIYTATAGKWGEIPQQIIQWYGRVNTVIAKEHGGQLRSLLSIRTLSKFCKLYHLIKEFRTHP